MTDRAVNVKRRNVVPDRSGIQGEDSRAIWHSVRLMAIGRKNRRAERRERVEAVVGAAHVDAALDVLELMELAWHDCYGESTPPEQVVDDVLAVSGGDLASLASAALLGVVDWRDLRVAAEDIGE